MSFSRHSKVFIPLLLLILFLITASCGLKKAPRAPKNSALPSIPGNYMYKKSHKEKEKEKEKESDKAEKPDLEQKTSS